ncbi:MAG: glycerol-3-phosphate 1-O-acyltransferase PlsY [Elusimicrobia bacterium]|nr:glycerol-3-phosphate 1-O-acyltransferase PlsY [Elusimicrobiota bacterium]
MNGASVALVAASYVSGAIPAGYLITKRAAGTDIREHGSGNPGAANVYKVVGPKAGLATLAADSLKGFFPVWLAARLFPNDLELQAVCGAFAIAGHVWTVFLKFRGGKAVATSAGVFAALLPAPLAVDVLIFAAGIKFSGHISIGSVAAAAAFPILAWAFRAPLPFEALAVGACGLILAKHASNLRRIFGAKRD